MGSKMDEFTANCILKKKSWLKMALHVYNAMGFIREELIWSIWEGVWKQIEEIYGEEIEGGIYYGDPYDGLFLMPKEGSSYYVVAETRNTLDKGRADGPVFSIYRNAEVPDKRHADHEDRLVASFLEQLNQCGVPWGPEDNYLARVNIWGDCVPRRWDGDDFLMQMIMNRKGVESCLSALLMQVYDNVKANLIGLTDGDRRRTTLDRRGSG